MADNIIIKGKSREDLFDKYNYVHVNKDGSINTINSKDSYGRASLNSVFGDSITAKRIADVSGQFHYGIPTGSASSSTNGSGSVSIVDSMLVLSTGTDIDGTSEIENKKTVRYIPGYDTFFKDIENLNLELLPGQMAVFCVNLPLGASGETGISIRWGELF